MNRTLITAALVLTLWGLVGIIVPSGGVAAGIFCAGVLLLAIGFARILWGTE